MSLWILLGACIWHLAQKFGDGLEIMPSDTSTTRIRWPSLSDQCLLYLANPQISVDNECTSAQVAGLYTSLTDQRNSRLLVYLIICLYDQLCAAVWGCDRVEICLPDQLYRSRKRTRRTEGMLWIPCISVLRCGCTEISNLEMWRRNISVTVWRSKYFCSTSSWYPVHRADSYYNIDIVFWN